MLEVAAEWERQRETIDPADMPLTRLLNSAIDGVAHTMAETRADILSYAGSDLLCYRAEEPDDAGCAPGARLRSGFALGGGVARRALQRDGRRDACRAAARGAGGDRRSARRVRRSRCARRAQRDDDADRIGAAGARGRARISLGRSRVASGACRRGLPGRALGRGRGGRGAARGALARVRGGGDLARGRAPAGLCLRRGARPSPNAPSVTAEQPNASYRAPPIQGVCDGMPFLRLVSSAPSRAAPFLCAAASRRAARGCSPNDENPLLPGSSNSLRRARPPRGGARNARREPSPARRFSEAGTNSAA